MAPDRDGLSSRPKTTRSASRPFTKAIADSFIGTHWRGEFPLPVAYWVVGVLCGVLFAILFVAVSAAMGTVDYNPYALFLVSSFLLLIGLTVTLWQCVGIWRSADKYVGEGRPAIWSTLAKMAVFFSACSVVINLVSTAGPQMRELSRMAFLDDPSIPGYEIRVMRGGTEMEISGGIKFGLSTDFQNVLASTPQLKTVHLDSVGGRIGEAIKMHSLILESGLDTFVAAQCLSACTVVFAAGSARYIKEDARLGYHAGDFTGISDSERASIDDEAKNVLRARGIAPWFLNRAYSEPHDSFWFPSHEELIRGNTISSVVGTDTFAVSGFGTDITPEELGRQLGSIELYAEIQRAAPDEYRKMIDNAYASYRVGETEHQFSAKMRTTTLPIITERLPDADQSVLKEAARLIAEQLRALNETSPSLCYNFYMKGIFPSQWASIMSAELQERERVLNLQVLRTSRPRAALDKARVDAAWGELAEKLAAQTGWESVDLLSKTDPNIFEQERICSTSAVMLELAASSDDSVGELVLRDLWRQ